VDLCDGVVVHTVLIVDDHPGFRAVARAVLSSAFRVVGEAGDAASGLARARELDPDVVLLDVQLPDGDGFDVARTLAERGVRPQVVLTSSLSRADIAPLLSDSPALGFIEKDQLSAAALGAALSSA
jgi:DNA-binding NarL/FixJ family response regulator